MDLKHASFIDPCNDNNFINSIKNHSLSLCLSLCRSSRIERQPVDSCRRGNPEKHFPWMVTIRCGHPSHGLRLPGAGNFFKKSCHAQRFAIFNRKSTRFAISIEITIVHRFVGNWIDEKNIFHVHPRCHYCRHFFFSNEIDRSEIFRPRSVDDEVAIARGFYLFARKFRKKE